MFNLFQFNSTQPNHTADFVLDAFHPLCAPSDPKDLPYLSDPPDLSELFDLLDPSDQLTLCAKKPSNDIFCDDQTESFQDQFALFLLTFVMALQLLVVAADGATSCGECGNSLSSWRSAHEHYAFAHSQEHKDQRTSLSERMWPKRSGSKGSLPSAPKLDLLRHRNKIELNVRNQNAHLTSGNFGSRQVMELRDVAENVHANRHCRASKPTPQKSRKRTRQPTFSFSFTFLPNFSYGSSRGDSWSSGSWLQSWRASSYWQNSDVAWSESWRSANTWSEVGWEVSPAAQKMFTVVDTSRNHCTDGILSFQVVAVLWSKVAATLAMLL